MGVDMGPGAAVDEHGDLSRAPDSYPGTPTSSPTLLLASCRHPLRPHARRPLSQAGTESCPHCATAAPHTPRAPLATALRRVGARPLGSRTAVVAVGSNASPAVMRHKLSSRGVSPVVPMITAVVRNLAVVHSAHVSRGGYVPAAPMHSSGARGTVVVQFLDDDQLAAVDSTEPNYERVPLDPARYPLVLSGGQRPGQPWIYATRRGVLRLPGLGARLVPQSELRALLRPHGVRTGLDRVEGDRDLAHLASPHGLIARPRRRPR